MEAHIPRHVAIIMDGNRRWAISRGLPKIEGHRRGAENFKHAVRALIARNIPVATFFAFSRENWRRTSEEISWLMGIFRELSGRGAEWMMREGVRLRIIGRIEDFPPDLAENMQRVMDETSANDRITVAVALSYGGREELVHAARELAEENRTAPASAISEEAMSEHLYTRGLPDVDLLVRTGGEKRLSGFLPWQAVYAELYFSDVLWPDFGERELDAILSDFANRKRNFGT